MHADNGTSTRINLLPPAFSNRELHLTKIIPPSACGRFTERADVDAAGSAREKIPASVTGNDQRWRYMSDTAAGRYLQAVTQLSTNTPQMQSFATRPTFGDFRTTSVRRFTAFKPIMGVTVSPRSRLNRWRATVGSLSPIPTELHFQRSSN